MTYDPVHCRKKVYRDWHFHQCARKVWRDGYCQQHHPDTIASKSEARKKQWEEEDMNRAKGESLRNAEHESLIILKAIINDLPTSRDWLDPEIEKAAREVIKKAGGRA